MLKSEFFFRSLGSFKLTRIRAGCIARLLFGMFDPLRND